MHRMRSEYPSHIVERVCKKAGVEPIDMLTALLVALGQHTSVATVAEQPGQAPTAMNEIIGFAALAKLPEAPRSVLEYLAHALRHYATNDEYEAKVAAATAGAKDAGKAELLAARAKAARALATVVQQVINQSEHLGLAARLHADEQANAKHRKKRQGASKPPDDLGKA